jgi:hypothetical protein
MTSARVATSASPLAAGARPPPPVTPGLNLAAGPGEASPDPDVPVRHDLDDLLYP